MKILILGATGATGRHLLEQGLASGEHITAFVRNPAGITIQNKNLVVIQGELSDHQKLGEAMVGQDAVVSVLGNKTRNALWEKSTIISDALPAIIATMKQTGVNRIILVTSFGVSDNIFLPEKWFIKIFLKNLFADIPLQESLIQKSGLQWTIVRPARLVNGPKTAHHRPDTARPIGIFSKISRADVAAYLLKAAQDPTTVGKVIQIIS